MQLTGKYYDGEQYVLVGQTDGKIQYQPVTKEEWEAQDVPEVDPADADD